MSSPVNATAKSPTANSYLTVAEADRIMRKRLYTTAWTNASTAADADGFLVNNGSGHSIGDSSVVVDTGTGTFPANCVIKFAGHDTEYTVQSAQTGAGTLSISPALTAAVADDEAVQR